MKANYNKSLLLMFSVSMILVICLLFLSKPYDKAHASYSQIPDYSYLKFSDSNYGDFNQIGYQSTDLLDLSSLVSDFNINYFENSDDKEMGNEESESYQQVESTYYDIPFPSSFFSNVNDEQKAFDYVSSPLVSPSDENNINSESRFSSDSMNITYSPEYYSSPLTDFTAQSNSALTSTSLSSLPGSTKENPPSPYQDFPLFFLTDEDLAPKVILKEK